MTFAWTVHQAAAQPGVRCTTGETKVWCFRQLEAAVVTAAAAAVDDDEQYGDAVRWRRALTVAGRRMSAHIRRTAATSAATGRGAAAAT